MDRMKLLWWGMGIAAIAIIFISVFVVRTSSCSSIEQINATIKVKIIPNRGMLGLNADTDSLKFGVVSPGITAQRKVVIEHKDEATVLVTMEGPLAVWTVINPAEFSLLPGEKREVLFDVNVPLNAFPGDYAGKAVFCIKEQG